jgi:hypothetical protein
MTVEMTADLPDPGSRRGSALPTAEVSLARSPAGAGQRSAPWGLLAITIIATWYPSASRSRCRSR